MELEQCSTIFCLSNKMGTSLDQSHHTANTLTPPPPPGTRTATRCPTMPRNREVSVDTVSVSVLKFHRVFAFCAIVTFLCSKYDCNHSKLKHLTRTICPYPMPNCGWESRKTVEKSPGREHEEQGEDLGQESGNEHVVQVSLPAVSAVLRSGMNVTLSITF